MVQRYPLANNRRQYNRQIWLNEYGNVPTSMTIKKMIKNSGKLYKTQLLWGCYLNKLQTLYKPFVCK